MDRQSHIEAQQRTGDYTLRQLRRGATKPAGEEQRQSEGKLEKLPQTPRNEKVFGHYSSLYSCGDVCST